MGLKCSPDIAQAAMKNVLSDIRDAKINIDDVGAFSNDWDHHVSLLATILWQLRENGFTINLLKCEWAVKETVFLVVLRNYHLSTPQSGFQGICTPMQ